MNFIELHIQCIEKFRDIIAIEIWEWGFESILETETGFKAYIPEGQYDVKIVSYLQDKYSDKTSLAFITTIIPKENWNAQWEKNFQPVEIGNKDCRIKASFHVSDPSFKHEIVIDPKMSFGTGHHESTTLMIEAQLGLDFKDKEVMDCGCGTGILSIFAKMLGARKVTGADIDDWSIENAVENAQLNNQKGIHFYRGSVVDLTVGNAFDIVLANINKNVLLQEMKEYKRVLKPTGRLVLSGFYNFDSGDIIDRAVENGLSEPLITEKNDWVSIVLTRD